MEKDTEQFIIESLKSHQEGRLSGFMCHLVEAIIRADPDNLKKLERAYPKLVRFMMDKKKGGGKG